MTCLRVDTIRLYMYLRLFAQYIRYILESSVFRCSKVDIQRVWQDSYYSFGEILVYERKQIAVISKMVKE